MDDPKNSRNPEQKQSRDSQQRIESLIKLLADGQFHSGQSLAESLNISRTAVWKMIEKLKLWQIAIFSVRGKGYKIDKGLVLLDQAKINQALKDKTQFFPGVISLASIDSTSSYIAREWQKAPGQPLVCVAEHQTTGRGRKGRKWNSPFGSNLYFSLGFNLPFGLNALGGLSLAIGISMARVLNRYSVAAVKLKWPNDLLIEGKKLAGILVEASGDNIDNSFINLGIGLNWRMALDQAIDQDWCNLSDYLSLEMDRNELLIQILLELDQCLQTYCRQGFASFSTQWDNYSAFIDRAICIETRQGKVFGKELGINSNGAIRVMTHSGESIFYSGEVSLRPA